MMFKFPSTVRMLEWGCLLIVGFLVLYPLFWLLLGSIKPSLNSPEYNLDAFVAIYQAEYMGEVLRNTAVMSIGVTILSVLIGVPLAWIVGRTDTPFKDYISMIAILPFIMPPVVVAVAWAYLGTPRVGFVNLFWKWIAGTNEPLFDIFTMGGLIFVMALSLAPYVFIFTVTAFKNMDPTLENAAHVSGANQWQTTFRITFPLAAPAILSGALLVFIQSLEIFAIPATIGVSGGIYVFATQLWRMMIGIPPNFSHAAAMSVPILLICGLALWGQTKALGRSAKYTTIGGKSFQPRLVQLGRLKWVALGFAGTYLLVSAILPLLTLIYGTFISNRGRPPTLDFLTLEHLREMLFGDGGDVILRSIGNSLFLSFIGATVGIALAAVVAFFVVRSKWKARGTLDFLALIPVAIPGAVIAIAMMWAYIREPFNLYHTIWIILLAYITRFLPFGVKAVSNAITQIHEELERAAAVSGANWFVVFWRVLVPLAMPGIVAGWIILFVSMMRELSASIMLFSSNNEVIGTILIQLYDEGLFSHVCILSLIIVILSLGSVALVRWITKQKDVGGLT
ncbi:iron ABC transporter permease [Alphaproteobacteria bacterium]|nr:iron ABC transporter permease [Alphaproteobacteria bacterium]